MSELNPQGKSEELTGETDNLTDILLVLNEQERKITAVKGVNKEGNLETVEPTQENESQFMKIDKHSSIASNFFTNFWNQIKNPSGLQFFKVNSKDATKTAKEIQNAITIKNPTPEMLEMLKKYRIDTEQVKSGHTQAKPESEKRQQPTVEEAGEQPEQKKEPYIDESKINWNSLSAWGITKQQLIDGGDYENMLWGNRSKQLYYVRGNAGLLLDGDARLQFRNAPDGQVVLASQFHKEQIPFDKPFYGHTFTPEDRKNLEETGNMGRIVDLYYPNSNKYVPSIISLDPKTNTFIQMDVRYLKIGDGKGGKEFSDEQKILLAHGRLVDVPGMIAKSGRKMECPIQASAVSRRVEYVTDKWYGQEMGMKAGEKHFKGNNILGAPLTPEQVKALNSNEEVPVKNMKSKFDGGYFDDVVRWNKDVGGFTFKNVELRKQQNQANKMGQVNGTKPEGIPHKQNPVKSAKSKKQEKPALQEAEAAAPPKKVKLKR